MSLNTEPRSPGPGSPKPYDCLLKFLLVGDSDVGKEELLGGMDNGSSESPYSAAASSCEFKVHVGQEKRKKMTYLIRQNREILENRLHDLEKQYVQKIRKLKKQNRAAAARAYVQQRLKEEAEQTNTHVKLQISSCQKQTSKSSRALEHNHSKSRRKSTSSLKFDDAEAWHNKASQLRPEDSKSRHEAFSVSENENVPLQHKHIPEKAARQSEFGSLEQLSALENNEMTKERHLQKDKKYERMGEEESEINNIVHFGISDLTIQTKHVPSIKTRDTSSVAVQKHNPKIPLKAEINSGNNKIDNDKQDVADGSSEDMFLTSPTTTVDSYTSEEIDADHDTDQDQVIIVPSHEELVRNKENLRHKNQVSKLKLSKYKKKNFVNPIMKEDKIVEEKKFMRPIKETERQASDVVRNELQNTCNSNITGIEKEVLELEIDQESSIPVNPGGDISTEGTVFSEGQVIVFERQLRVTNQDNEFSKMSKKCLDVKISKAVSNKSPEISGRQGSIESTVSAVCDNESGEVNEENTKIRRRSGSRKRRSSGLETQRRSSRLSGQSSQDSLSQSIETEDTCISPIFLAAGESAAKKRVIISSVFQCLIDEGRRKSDIEEFKIPNDVLVSELELKTVPDHNLTVSKEQCSKLWINEEKMVNVDQKDSKLELSNEKDNIQPLVSNLPTTDTCDVNFTEKDDVMSPTLFESQPTDSSIFTFSNKEPTIDVSDTKAVNIEKDFINKENEQVIKEIEKVNKGNEQVMKDDEQFNNNNELKKKENELGDKEKVPCNINKEKELHSEENELCSKENELSNKETEMKDRDDELSLAEDRVRNLSLDQQHDDHVSNMDEIDESKNKRSSDLQLQQIGDFQVPKGENVHSVMCVEITCDDQVQPYVVCLCSSCLKLYTICNNQWTCVANTKLGFVTKKKSGNLMYLLPDSDSVSLILLGIKSDCTCIYHYTFIKGKWQQTALDQVYSKSIQVCPLSSRLIVVSYYTDERSYLCKYTQDINSDHWSNFQLDYTKEQITHLIPVRGIPDAVLTLTKSTEIQIWNHEHGYLLTSVDISDVCPADPICSISFAEQGFLFVPLLSKKKGGEAGTIVVINPSMNTSETLSSITVNDSWTGCSGTCIMSAGLLLCRQNNGCIRMWNVYTGGLLATVDDVTVTCFSATNQLLVAAHKHCVHIYKLDLPSLS